MGVWYGRGVGVGMGVLHLMRVMRISYFMTVICVGRGGVGWLSLYFDHFFITMRLCYVVFNEFYIISINLLTQNVGV